jgi:hypothetical protein
MRMDLARQDPQVPELDPHPASWDSDPVRHGPARDLARPLLLCDTLLASAHETELGENQGDSESRGDG